MVRIWRAGDQLPELSAGMAQMCTVKPTFQHIQANATEPVDVWVVYLSEESDLGRGHGVVVGKEKLKLEDAAYRRPG